VKDFLRGFGKYVLWLISTGICVYCYLLFRGVNLLMMQSLGWNRHLINLMDKAAMLVLGLIVIAVILLIQHLYIEKSLRYFLLVTAIQVMIYAFVQFVNLKLRSSLMLADYLILGVLIAMSVILYYSFLTLKRKQKTGPVL